MLDLIFTLAPFVLAWRLTGWPGKHRHGFVNFLGVVLMLLSATLLLRLVIFGNLPPLLAPSLPAMTTEETLEICAFTAAIGMITMLTHLFFMRERD